MLSIRKSAIWKAWNSEPVKEVTEWVNSFVIMERKFQSIPAMCILLDTQYRKKILIFIDVRDLNESLEREPYYT